MNDRLNYSSAGATRNRTNGPLIPMSGVRIFATEYPKGFQVARYDADGLATDCRWFSNYANAKARADQMNNS